MEQHNIPITKKARYFSTGNKDAGKLLIILHGYGQLAEYFIQKFESISKEDYYIIVPEGTHRFYLKGSSGRVGASWMTRELRENDIQENNEYLNSLLKFLLNERDYPEISILGFSQGGATAARWMHTNEMNLLAEKGKIKNFILWASVFPPDINYEDFQLQHVSKTFVIGTEDEFYAPDQQQEVIAFYEKLNFSVIHFEGRHDIEQKIVLLILK